MYEKIAENERNERFKHRQEWRRNWSNKKLVCFSNYSLLASSLWLPRSSNRLIIIRQKILSQTNRFSLSSVSCVRLEVGEKLICNIDKYGKAMQIYSSPIRRSLIESIERCQSLPKVSLAVNCNDILLQSDFMLITLLNWKRLTFCRSTWVLLWGQ